MKDDDWRAAFREGEELVVATSSNDCIPNANIVISLGFVGERLLIADCQMATTLHNLKQNRRVALIGGY